MSGDRRTVFVDACALAGALRRNLLLTLAEAELFRLRWSREVLAETERAIAAILAARGVGDAAARAGRARAAMESAFDDAMVENYDDFLGVAGALPDRNDAHVVAAAAKAQAQLIVTDNLKHFPERLLRPLALDVRSSDGFIADSISLDRARALPAIRRMRGRFRRPDMDGERLLLAMQASGLVGTADALRGHVAAI